MELYEKIERLADVLDRDACELNEVTKLDEIGWDSMGMLSVIALAKQNGKTITGAQIHSPRWGTHRKRRSNESR